MFVVWDIGQDEVIGSRSSRSSAFHLARQSSAKWVMIVEADNDSPWSRFGNPIVVEFVREAACTHVDVDEDEIVALHGFCPVCGQMWLSFGGLVRVA